MRGKLFGYAFFFGVMGRFFLYTFLDFCVLPKQKNSEFQIWEDGFGGHIIFFFCFVHWSRKITKNKEWTSTKIFPSRSRSTHEIIMTSNGKNNFTAKCCNFACILPLFTAVLPLTTHNQGVTFLKKWNCSCNAYKSTSNFYNRV